MTSLAAAHSEDGSLVALAGINSSVAEQKKDNNQHLRSFKIEYPARSHRQAESGTKEKARDKPAGRKTTALSRTSLFLAKGGDTYQRTLRLSPWKGAESPRVGAIATGLAPWGEIVFFNATPTPTETDIIGRIRLGNGEEAEDVDIVNLDVDKGIFKVAYTNGADVFTCQVSSETRSTTAPDVRCVYYMPKPAKPGLKKPKFRALRFLSPTTLLLLQNAPDRSGCELVVLNVSSGRENSGSGEITQRRSLRRTMKIGLGLDVCNLGADAEDKQQTLVAVSGSDLTIEILTIDYTPRTRYTRPKPYTTLRSVHPFSMTKLCFSPFTPPTHPISPEIGPQNVKLASVSMGNTVVVHTFPLSPYPAPSRTPRYVLVQPGRSDTTNLFLSVVIAVFAIALGCLSMQVFAEIRGASAPYLGIVDWLPAELREAVVKPYVIPPSDEPFRTFASASSVPTAQATPHPTPSPTPNSDSDTHSPETEEQEESGKGDTLTSLLHARLTSASPPDSDSASTDDPILIRCGPSDTDIQIETLATASPDFLARAVPWTELSTTTRETCMRRLEEAGVWTVTDDVSERDEEGGFVGVLFYRDEE